MSAFEMLRLPLTGIIRRRTLYRSRISFCDDIDAAETKNTEFLPTEEPNAANIDLGMKGSAVGIEAFADPDNDTVNIVRSLTSIFEQKSFELLC